LLFWLDEEYKLSSLCKQKLQFYGKTISRLKQKGRFFRAHISPAQNLLNIAPRGSKQSVFRARTNTEKKL